ncbi:MAG: hypothetical protein ACX931_06940 [Saccharospirillum sp.]
MVATWTGHNTCTEAWLYLLRIAIARYNAKALPICPGKKPTPLFSAVLVLLVRVFMPLPDAVLGSDFDVAVDHFSTFLVQMPNFVQGTHRCVALDDPYLGVPFFVSECKFFTLVANTPPLDATKYQPSPCALYHRETFRVADIERTMMFCR